MSKKLQKAVYAVVAVKGLFTALAPRQSLKVATSGWRLGLKNVGELEPREWYVTAIRATGVGMLAAGGVGLLLTGEDETVEGDEATDGDVEPIEISPDEDAE